MNYKELLTEKMNTIPLNGRKYSTMGMAETRSELEESINAIICTA